MRTHLQSACLSAVLFLLSGIFIFAHAGIEQNSPTISDLSPAVAPYYGGPLTLTINGADFLPGAVVSLGTTNLTTTFVSPARLSALVPASSPGVLGAQSVSVYNPGGLVSNSVSFRTVVRGDINSSGTINIGDALVAALTAGGVNNPPLPLSVGDVNVSGTTNIGDALVLALFAGRITTNWPIPSIFSVSPSTVVAGSTLTITGRGFAPDPADNRVLFHVNGGGVIRLLPRAGAAGGTLELTVPDNVVSGSIQVHRVDVPLGGSRFPLNVAGSPFPLELTDIDPAGSALIGGSVTLTGSGFDAIAANNMVRFKTSTGTVDAAAVSASANSLVVTIPADAVCGPLTVTTGGQTSNARLLMVSGTACAFQTIDVWRSGWPGDTLVIEGAGFDVVNPTANSVKFIAAGGGTVNAQVLAAGGTQLHIRIPDSAIPGSVLVAVGASTSNTLSYRAPSPSLPAGTNPTTGYMISTIAGVSTIAEGGFAADQLISGMRDVATDASGNLFVVSSTRHKVFRIATDGTITTFAGTGTPGPAGDGGPAAVAQLKEPSSIAVDAGGNLYIADTSNRRIRKVAPNG